MMTFAERLQYLIDGKNISQRRLATAIGVDSSKVSKWLRGKVSNPQRTTVVKIAAFFGCDIDWLATGKGEPFPEEKTTGNIINIKGKGGVQKWGNISSGDGHKNITEIQQNLSAPEQYLLDLINKLPNKEDILQKFIAEAIAENKKRKKHQEKE